MVPSSLPNYNPEYDTVHSGSQRAFCSICHPHEGLTWNERTGLQLPDDVAQLPLEISSTGVLEGLQHALSVDCTITLCIKLGKGLQDKRCKKIRPDSNRDFIFLFFFLQVSRPVIFVAVVVMGRVYIYHSKNKLRIVKLYMCMYVNKNYYMYIQFYYLISLSRK